MSNKMLIDASHPEETRVAVVRGNRIEEFDFESQEKRQLRGNIYLAKVTRVEPSLQAAFIDYGGNRHGFLAFSEIHPDYYQIPVADRQALLEAEAEEARAARDADDADDAHDDDQEEPAPKKKRGRRSRKSKAATEDVNEAQEDHQQESDEGETPESMNAKAASDEETTVSEEKNNLVEASETEEEVKPKRKTTRRRTSRKKASAESDPQTNEDTDSNQSGDSKDSENSASSGDDEDGTPTTMAAMVETDTISEDLPEENGETGDEATDSETSSEAEEKPKPKRRPRRRKTASKSDDVVADTTTDEPKDAAETSNKVSETVEGEETADASAEEASTEEVKDKPRKRSRRSPRRKKASDEEIAEASTDEHNDDDSENGDDENIESVGQEDALEEVPEAPRRTRRHYKIQEVIKRRQILLVQVVKEERGTKGAALTTYLSLAGRYSVLMPNTARGGGISRKITNSADRKRLKAIASELEVPDGMGVILRTAGASRTKADINRDFEYLLRLWGQVRNLTLSSTAPCLVYEEGSLIKRSIRDLYDKDTSEIVVSGDEGYREAKDFMTMLMPSHAKKVKRFKEGQSLLTKYGVESQLDKMMSPQVTLKSGGYLVINQTEALVAVDVNSGRSTREHSVENTALSTNMEAAEEVARQLRLRDLAGLIVIDFIDMEERRNNRAVEKKLKDCLKNDRARIQVGRISHFGLMEMSRQRMRASVLESTMDLCPHCVGTGYVRSDSTIALQVFRALEEHVSRHNRFDCVVKASPAVALNLLNSKRAALVDLETRYGLQVIVESDPQITGQAFEISKGEPAKGEPTHHAVVGYQSDSNLDETEEAVVTEAENEETPRSKRRRNRKRKSSGDAQRQEASEDATSSPEAENAGRSDDEETGNKRRRGKRGSRVKNDTAQEDVSSSEVTETAKAGVAQDAEAKSNNSSNDEDETANKVKSRSTRRRKAPIAPKTTQEDKPSSTDTPQEVVAEAPPRKPRRRTSRKSEVVETVAETSTVEQEEVAVEPERTVVMNEETTSSESVTQETASQEQEEQPDGKKKKRSGWWPGGKGFF